MPQPITVSGVSIAVMRALGLVSLFVQALMASVLVRIVDGGTHARDLQDFTLLLWVAYGTAWGSWKLVTSVGTTELGAAG
jgi:archaellum biogenesis protein FlaJ (TadC family)